MFYVLLRDNEQRNRGARRDVGRGRARHVPLRAAALLAGGRRFAAHPTECPVTDDLSGRLLRLPFFTTLSDDDADRVVDTFVTALERG